MNLRLNILFIVFLDLIFFSAPPVFSQSLNFNFPQNDTVIYNNIVLQTQLDLNLTGSNLNWDFRPLNIIRNDTVFFGNPTQFPMADSFPSATNAVKLISGSWMGLSAITFFTESVQKIEMIGESHQSEVFPQAFVPTIADNPGDWFYFPVQLGSSFTDTFISHGAANGALFGIPYDSIRIKIFEIRHDTMDAHGTIQLTDRTYPDVLRKQTTVFYTDSMFRFDENINNWVFGVTQSRIQKYYSWLGDSTDFIIASVEVIDDTIRSIQVTPQTYIPPPHTELIFQNVHDTVISGIVQPAFQVHAVHFPDSVLVSSFNGTVVLSLQNGNGVTLFGNNFSPAVNGIAEFTGVSLLGSGDAIVNASADTFDYGSWNVHVLPQPPPTIFLEIINLSDSVVTGIPNSFDVVAKKISDGTLLTSYQDTIRLTYFSNSQASLSFSSSQVADNGVASFSNILFSGNGVMNLIAYSDTTVSDTFQVTVFNQPNHYEFSNLSGNFYENVPVTPLGIYVKDIFNNQTFYNDTVRIGKISGTGNITGTLKKKAHNGFVSFDDIVFTYPGIYQVICFAGNAPYNSPSILSDTISITVLDDWGDWTFSHVDTLTGFVDRSSFWIWHGNDDGYLSGTSRAGWYSEVAQKFDFTGKARLTGLILYFAYRDVIGSSDTYKIKIYNSGVQHPSTSYPAYLDSIPLEFLGEQIFSVDDIITTDFFIKTPTFIPFSTPVNIYSDFHVALEVNSTTADDTIVLWTSLPPDGNGERRTSRLSHGIIQPEPPYWIMDYFFLPYYNVDFMIEPILEIDTNSSITSNNNLQSKQFTVFPNPAYAEVSILSSSGFDAKDFIRVTDITGKVMILKNIGIKSNEFKMNISVLKPGLYFISIPEKPEWFTKLEVIR